MYELQSKKFAQLHFCKKKILSRHWDLNPQLSILCLLTAALSSLHGFGSKVTWPILEAIPLWDLAEKQFLQSWPKLPRTYESCRQSVQLLHSQPRATRTTRTFAINVFSPRSNCLTTKLPDEEITAELHRNLQPLHDC